MDGGVMGRVRGPTVHWWYAIQVKPLVWSWLVLLLVVITAHKEETLPPFRWRRLPYDCGHCVHIIMVLSFIPRTCHHL